MKKVSLLIILTVLVLLGTKSTYTQSTFPTQRLFEFVYHGKLINLPSDADKIRIWIPLASSREQQRILSRSIEVPATYQITVDPKYGNELLYFELEGPRSNGTEFSVRYVTEIRSDKVGREGERLAEANNPEKFLEASQLMRVTDEVAQFAEKAVPREDSRQKMARRVYDAVIDHMEYDKETPGWGRGDAVRACLVGKGNCTDFHSLFIAMAHWAKIPARFQIGFTIPSGAEGFVSGYHCWAEYYDEEKGWVQIDASEAWKHPERKEDYFGGVDTNKFLLSIGRDIILTPAQAGDPINILFYPHVEVDGKAFEGVETSFAYKEVQP